jgi:RNase P/RNase MRP subunit p29
MRTFARYTIQPLIGLTATVVQATNPVHARLTGRVIEDSHGTLTISDGLRTHRIPKASCTFDIVLPTGKTARIEGKSLVGHPAERLRRAKKLRW